MFSKLILCTSPSRLVVGHWRLGRFTGCEIFKADTEGREAFKQYLGRYAKTPAYLIANVAEEDYRTEIMPHTSGTARNEMLARKLAQTYRTSQYRATQFIEREPGQRRDDRFLLMALNNADNVSPWVAILEEQQVLLAGVYMLPILTQQLLATWKIKAQCALLISRQSIGIRQTYFRNGKLCFSRLTPIRNMEVADGVELAELFFSEAQKTRAYLSSQRLIDLGADLQLVAYNASKDTCHHLVATERSIACVAISADEIAKRLGLPPELLKEYPELPHMHALASQVPTANIAPAALTKKFFLKNWRNVIHFASIAVLIGSMGLSYSYWLQARDNDDERALAMKETARQISNYEQVAKSFPKTPFSADELRIVVEMAKKLAESARTPQLLMQVVSTALDEMPEIQLNRLHWKLTDDLNVVDDDKDTQMANPTPVSTVSQTVNNEGLHEIGFVVGEIRNFRGDYRTAVESVTHLSNLLRKNGMVDQVVIVNQPINASSLVALQGTTREGQVQQSSAALFKLKIVLKQEKHT